jgi:hypothetical protein
VGRFSTGNAFRISGVGIGVIAAASLARFLASSAALIAANSLRFRSSSARSSLSAFGVGAGVVTEGVVASAVAGKGPIARALFYMAVRYDGTDPDVPDLELSDTPNAAAYVFGKLSTLLAWNRAFPVTEAEHDGERYQWTRGLP